jgi:hypothetical protein
MKKRWIAVIVAVIAAVAIGYVLWQANQSVYLGPGMKYVEEPKIESNDWQPYKAIDPSDSTHVYKVTWSQKYGATQVMYCKVIFRNDKEKQYRLVAPWLNGLDIERQNMDDIQFDRIPRDSVPKGFLEE